MSTQHQFAAAPVPAASDSDPVVPSGGGGSSPAAVFAELSGSLSAAELASSSYFELTVGPNDGGAWDATDPTTVIPPQSGRYHVYVDAYGSGTLDAPLELTIRKFGGSAGGYVAVPTGATSIYAGNGSRDLSLDVGNGDGIRIKGGYSDSAPTTGGVDITVYVHRIGDLP